MPDSIQALFIDGPRAREIEIIAFPPPPVYDCETPVSDPGPWELGVRGPARFEQHRYVLAGYGWDGDGARVALYEHSALVIATAA